MGFHPSLLRLLLSHSLPSPPLPSPPLPSPPLPCLSHFAAELFQYNNVTARFTSPGQSTLAIDHGGSRPHQGSIHVPLLARFVVVVCIPCAGLSCHVQSTRAMRASGSTFRSLQDCCRRLRAACRSVGLSQSYRKCPLAANGREEEQCSQSWAQRTSDGWWCG